MLPLIDDVLELVRLEYSMKPPTYKTMELTNQDFNYLLQTAMEKDPFDKNELKKGAITNLLQGTAIATKTKCQYGEIIAISFTSDPLPLEWNTWWRAVHLLSPKNPVRIVFFGHPRKREFPVKETVESEHINGGSTYRCNSQTILVYRKEEATRVLLHELFHANCSDPYKKSVPFVEADTEAWAEIMLCAMDAKGQKVKWEDLMKKQVEWAVRQTATLRDHYAMKGPSDYAWRYTEGRLDVWKAMGIPILPQKKSYKKADMLRLTLCEPSND
jgi:hypothetical protein